MRMLLIALLLLCPTWASAQIIVPDTLDPYKPMIAHVQGTFPEGAEVKTTWTVPEAVSMVATADTEVHLWAPPGTYKISATIVWMKFNVVTVDGQQLKVMEAWDLVQFDKNIIVGDGTPPPPGPGPTPPGPTPPEPDPTVPEDEYGNIGRKVSGWASGLDNRDKVKAVYSTAGKRLLGEETPILPTIDNAVLYIRGELGSMGLGDDWKAWAAKIDPEWDRYVSDRNTAGGFLKAVSAGL